METKRYRTRQERGPLTYPKGKDFIIGLDAGYSGMKVFYETGYVCFPSYARKWEGDMLNLPDEKDILFRDDGTGEVYLVGANAQDMIDDTNDTEGELYSRKRYADPRFRILCYTAVGLAAMKKKDARKVAIQTGLPASYMKDADAFRKVFNDIPAFSLRIGTKGGWVGIHLDVSPEDVSVMAQPKGALYSVITRNDGSFTPDAMGLLKGSVMVLDAGFRTFDFYGIKDRRVACQDSVNDISMHEVFQQATDKIASSFGEEVRIPALQKLLSTGTVVCVDEETLTSEEKDFSQILAEADRDVFCKAKAKIRSVADAFRGYQYVIVDGGTGEAWYAGIKEWLSGMKTLKVIPSNVNDRLPFVYSNARGYYMYRYTASKR